MNRQHCGYCANQNAEINELKAEIRHLLRIAEKHPGTPRAKGCLSKIPSVKAHIEDNKRSLVEHLQESA